MKTLKLIFHFLFLLLFFGNCTTGQSQQSETSKTNTTTTEQTKITQQPLPKNIKYTWHNSNDASTRLINQVPTPEGFQRVKTSNNSFQQWLQFLPLSPKGEKIKLYDGSTKWKQSANHRLINIDVGKRDLQQCADAVMRLRSEFLFGKKQYSKIHFNYTNGTKVSFDDWRNGKKPIVKGNKVTFSNTGKKDDSYASFKKYLIQIFNYAGTASLEKEMKKVPIMNMQIGDVLIQGGHPGHAILVVDMAENENGEKLYLLAQSYMPAQSIHILKNPSNRKLSPWFKLNKDQEIDTPDWGFMPSDLKRF